MLSDGELLHRFVAQQDEVAFREIVHRYTPLVMGVALRTTHDRQAAEDVLQATFLVLVEKAESLDDPTQIAAWLHGVAMRIARRLVDKRHRHREQPYRHENHVMDPAVTTDPFERVCQTRDHDVLGEELQRLPEKLRTPMVLRYLEDLSNEQVAERLGLKVSTVEGRLKRGKKELRRRLARRGVTLGAAMLVWNMTQQSVQDILQSLADRHGISIYFDWIDLETTQLDELELPINVSNVPLATALDLLLRPVLLGHAAEDGSRWRDFNNSQLTYFVRDDVLVITTREIAEQTMQVRTYDLRPLDVANVRLDRAALVDAIRTMTGESTWDEQGGRGTLIEGDTTLTIRQSLLVHREIEALLEQLLHAAETTAEPAE